LKEIKRLDTEDTQEANNTRKWFKERLAKVEQETKRLKLIEAQLLESPDQQIALTDPDARIMATTGRNTVKIGYNVQSAVDTGNHLIVDHEVTNVGNDRTQLSNMARKAKDILGCLVNISYFVFKRLKKGRHMINTGHRLAQAARSKISVQPDKIGESQDGNMNMCWMSSTNAWPMNQSVWRHEAQQ